MVRLKDRSWLAVADGALLLTMLLAGLVAGLTLLVAVTSNALGGIAVALPKDQVRDLLAAGVTVDSAQAVVSGHAELGYRLAWWLVGPATSLLVLWGAWMLHQIVASAGAGDPFVAANVRRIRVLGGLAVGFWVATIAQSMVGMAVQDHLRLHQAHPLNISFDPLVWVVVLYALAAIWQRGVDMRDEQQLTV
ncbi:MAG: hypothetical protein QOG43_2581 [Actinomycetota bacterium]|jgi:hypothetical protein|nr:hypothetical protein [Actinomycetota bacterium]